MRSQSKAIVCALRGHGEHGAIVRLMTREQGLIAAYVRGARGRRMRPVLIPGNVVQADFSARTLAAWAYLPVPMGAPMCSKVASSVWAVFSAWAVVIHLVWHGWAHTCVRCVTQGSLS